VRPHPVGGILRGVGSDEPAKRLAPGGEPMSEAATEVKVGMKVPDFELTCYDPKVNNFTKAALADLKKQGKWTILFFYPADFTFV
jgi:peroxiredoxin (alkyl hydroperoxide reductase subunit C)